MTQKIKSDRREESPRPWYDFEANGLVVTINEANGAAACEDTTATKDTDAELVGTHQLELGEDRLHALAVDLDGQLRFDVPKHLPNTLYAHLGFYHPGQGWDLIEMEPLALTQR